MKQVECGFCGCMTNVGAPCTTCTDQTSDNELQWQWKEWNSVCPSDTTSFQWQWKEWNSNSVNDLDDIPF